MSALRFGEVTRRPPCKFQAGARPTLSATSAHWDYYWLPYNARVTGIRPSGPVECDKSSLRHLSRVTGRRSMASQHRGNLILDGLPHHWSPLTGPEEAPQSVLSPVTIGASSFSGPDNRVTSR